MKAFPATLSNTLQPAAVSISRRILGLAFLLICLSACLILVLQHFGATDVPGCGPRSGCVSAVASQWGTLFGWPVSFLGFAYFAALAVAWILTTASGVSMLIRAAIRLGAVASAAYLLIMCLEQYFCVPCLIIHISNLVFWIIVEKSQQATQPAPATILTLLAGFALVTSLLNVGLSEQSRRAIEQAGLDSYIDAAESDRNAPRIAPPAIATTPFASPTTPDPDSDSTAIPSTPIPEPKPDAALVGADSKTQRERPGGSEASGQQPSLADKRELQTIWQPFRIGSDQAKGRLVVFYDYQSAPCWRIERDIENLLSKYSDNISVTARHYPLCSDCNISLDSNSHPNACRAAFAAEAAGLLKGSDGFWQMHRWLLQKRGTFTDEELKRGLVELGYDDTNRFLDAMDSPPVLGRVLADIVEAQSLKIQGTPTVLFNGEKLAGLQSGTGLMEALLAAANKKKTSELAQAAQRSSPIDLSATDAFPEQLQLAAANATVRIVNTAGRSVGSGVIVAARDPFVYVLTANHIVPGIKRVEVQTYSEESYPEPAGVYSYATVVANSESADLAVIRFSTRDPMPEPLPILPPELVHQLVVPQGKSLPVLTIGYDDRNTSPSCLVTEVIDTQRVRRTPGEAAITVWEVDRQSAPGRSGGPLIDGRGYVLGIASGVAEGKAYFAHVEDIHRFLQVNGLNGLISATQHK